MFAMSRLSRKSYEREYGKSSTKDKFRFSIIFLCILGIMLSAVSFYPIAAALLIAAVIFCGFLGVLGTKSGIYKDIMYSAAISCFIAGFTGVLVHGM